MKSTIKLLIQIRSYCFYLITEGELGYIVLTYGNKLDFRQCMCCWEDDRQEIGDTIKTNRGALTKLILCGTCSDYNAQLGIEATFDDLDETEEDAIKAHVTALKGDIDAELNNCRKKESNMRDVRSLLENLRYGDARQHCQVCGLDYDFFLKEIAEKHSTK